MNKIIRRPKRNNTPVHNDMRWKPIYDTVIMMHCLGKTKDEIRTKTKLHPRSIDRVIRSAEGVRLALKYRQDSNQHFKEHNHERLVALQERAFHNMEKVLTSEELLSSNPLAVFDRSVKFLESQRPVPQSNVPGQPVTNNTVVINSVPQGLIDRVNNALAMVESLNGPVRVIDKPGAKEKSLSRG